MKKETWRILLLITGLGLVLLVTTLLTRTILLASKQAQVEGRQSNVSIDRNEAAERLSHAIQFKTISHSDETQFDKAAFLDFQNYVEQAFPLVHAQLTKEIINQYSLLYTWKGQDENLKPMLLMGHLDVVPVETGTDKEWQYPPFEGRIADGYIWGRGAMDDKSSMLGILEAVEILLEEEFKPQRTIYLAFGHDEEIGGHNGAAEIAALLKRRGIELEYVLDEGLAIGEDFVPFLSRPVALVGIAEKGYVHIELSVESKGGHSSVPPSHTAIGILSAAIYKLERNPFPLELTDPIAQMLEYLAPEMPFGIRMVLANRWLFGGLTMYLLSKDPTINAGIRTTTAATIFQGGIKENILPSTARAVVNFRILPGESIESVLEHVRQTIDDPQVKIRALEDRSEPSFVSDTNSQSFNLLQKTIRQIFDDALIAPSLTAGASDSRHYGALSQNIYRFGPMRGTPEDLARVHGTNERLSIDNYEQAIKFYIQLIRNSNP